MTSEEQRKLASALARLAQAASSLADGVKRELGGELSRQASVLAVDLEAMALKLHVALPMPAPAAVTPMRFCSRCGNRVAGVEGLCGNCEAVLAEERSQ